MRIFNTRLTGTYINPETFRYFSPRYQKWVTVEEGEVSDGASGAVDVHNSKSYIVHDVLKKYQKFDDGTKCTNSMASWIIYDILKSEGRWFRARTWFLATLAWGSVVKKKPLERTKENLSKFN